MTVAVSTSKDTETKKSKQILSADTEENQQYVARLKHISFSYDGGKSWALQDLSLSIRSGEHLVIWGANGSGKSTLGHILDGSTAPDLGRVELLGKVVCDSSNDEEHRVDPEAYRSARHNIGLVFQNPEDQIVTTVVRDDVAFGPENLGEPRPQIAQAVKDSLQQVDMLSQADHDPTRMSGGQQQRLAVAGNLAMHPTMIILDEPGAMLDSAGQRDMLDIMARLTLGGTSVIHITHRLEQARSADRVIVLDHGRIIAQGTPHAVLDGHQLPGLGMINTDISVSQQQLPASLADSEKSLQSELLQARGGQNTPTDMLGHVISLKDVAYQFPDSQDNALNHISLSIDAGETVAILGRNGSGKSTLCRVIAALLTPTNGSVSVTGIPIAIPNSKTPKKTRRHNLHLLRQRVGYVMQYPEHQLFADTVFLDVSYGPRNMGLTPEQVNHRVNEALGLLGISDVANCSPFHLSGGQKRLVAIAGVLACKPQLLILDEVTASLDPQTSERIISMLEELHSQGVTIIMNTHADQEALRLADTAVLLDQGELSAQGPVEEVLKHYHSLLNSAAHRNESPDSQSLPDQPLAQEALEDAPSQVTKNHSQRNSSAPLLLQELDPRAKMVTFVLAMVTAFCISKPLQLCLGLLVTAALFAAARFPIRRILTSTRIFLILIVLTSLLNLFITRTGNVLVDVGPLLLTDDGLWVAILYSCRFLIIILLGALLVETTTPTQITDALESLIKPLQCFGIHTNEIALVMSLALRFIPTLSQETHAIIKAQTARGGSIETGSLVQRLRAAVAIAVPVFASALRHADNLSMALDARCYEGGRNRSHYRLLSFNRQDYIFIGLMVLYVLSLIVLSVY